MSFRNSLKYIFFLAFCLYRPLEIFAQQTGASVRGTVADPDEAVIPGATVTFTPATGRATVVTSQADGSYTVRNLPAGTYSLTVTMSGFASFVKQGIRLSPGQSLVADAKMAIQAQSQEVQVNAQSVQLSTDPDSNASATTIKGKDLDALSDDPDELSSELSALAGPAAGTERRPDLRGRFHRGSASAEVFHSRDPHQPESILRAVRQARLWTSGGLHQARNG